MNGADLKAKESRHGGARSGAGRPRKYPREIEDPARVAARLVRLRKLACLLTELAAIDAEIRSPAAGVQIGHDCATELFDDKKPPAHNSV
jgi:hypothetical protein